MNVDLFGNEVEAGVGRLVSDPSRHTDECQCGCGAEIQWKGYGRKPKYLNRTHGERARRQIKAHCSIAISYQAEPTYSQIKALLAYVVTHECGISQAELQHTITALDFLASNDDHLSNKLQGLKRALQWLGA